MLLTVQNLWIDVSCDMVWKVISENKRDLLAFFEVDMSNYTLSKHAFLLYLGESNSRAGHGILFATINCNI